MCSRLKECGTPGEQNQLGGPWELVGWIEMHLFSKES